MFTGRVRKFVGVVLCAVLVLSALPLQSFAAEVDRKTAADPAAVLTQIGEMNLPDMPDQLADQLRGGYWYILYLAPTLVWLNVNGQMIWDTLDAYHTLYDVVRKWCRC